MSKKKFPKTLYVGHDDAEEGITNPYLLANGDREIVMLNADDDEEIAVYELVTVNRLAVTRELKPKRGRR